MTDDINKKLDYLNETKQLIRAAIEEKGPVITDEDTLRSYVDKIKNIESLDPNTAKVFTSIEEMNQDDKVFIGKKAIVYNRHMMPLDRETNITDIYIPETFTLSKSVEDQYYQVQYRSVNTSVSDLQLIIYMEANMVQLELRAYYSSSYAYMNYKWTSEDGINFINTQAQHSSSFGSNKFGLFELGTETKYYNGSWTDLFGEIFTSNRSEFYGLYEYNDSEEDREYINTFANLHKTYEEVDGVTIKDTAYDTIPLYITDIKNKLITILQNNEIDETYFSNTCICTVAEYENNIPKILEAYIGCRMFADEDKGKLIKDYQTGNYTSVPTYTKCVFNLIDMTVNIESGSTFAEKRSFMYSDTDGLDCYLFTIKDCPRDVGTFRAALNKEQGLIIYDYQYVYGTSSSTNASIVASTEYNIYYKRPKYNIAPTQLSSVKVNELFTNKTVYTKNGIIKSDGSYLTNIKNSDFFHNWLPGTTSTSIYTYVLQTGTKVPNQTFLERVQIPYTETLNQGEEDCVVELDTNIGRTDITLDPEDTLYKVYKSYLYYNRTVRYNGKVYWYAIGINWDNNSVRQYVTAIHGVVYDAETGERLHEFSDTTKWQPINTGTTPKELYSMVNFAQYIPARNEFVILFDTDSWGWTHGAWGATYRYNVVSKGRSVQASINLGKHGVGDYYSISESSFDASTNSFYCIISSWYADQASKSQYIVKLDSSANVSVVYTDTSISSLTAHNGYFWLDYQDRGPLFNYSIAANKWSKLVNLSNGKVLTLNNCTNTFSTDKFVVYNNEYYILYKTVVDDTTTIYVDKLNISNMTRTNIINFISSDNYSFYFVDNELCLCNSSNYKLFDLSNNYLFTVRSINDPIIKGISGVNTEKGDLITEALYFYVSTGSMTFTTYKKDLKFYVFKSIEKFPIKGELFISGSSSSSSTKDSTVYKYNVLQLTKLNVTDKQYQQYLDSMDQLLYENEVEE